MKMFLLYVALIFMMAVVYIAISKKRRKKFIKFFSRTIKARSRLQEFLEENKYISPQDDENKANSEDEKIRSNNAANGDWLSVSKGSEARLFNFLSRRSFLLFALLPAFIYAAFLTFRNGFSFSAFAGPFLIIVASTAFLASLTAVNRYKYKFAATKELSTILIDLNVSVEAGLIFDEALAKIVKVHHGPVTAALRGALEEMQRGKTRRESLHDAAAKLNDTGVEAFAKNIDMANSIGVSLTKVLRMEREKVFDRMCEMYNGRILFAMSISTLINLIVVPLLVCTLINLSAIDNYFLSYSIISKIIIIIIIVLLTERLLFHLINNYPVMRNLKISNISKFQRLEIILFSVFLATGIWYFKSFAATLIIYYIAVLSIYSIFKYIIFKHTNLIEESMVDFLLMEANSLKAGYSILQSLDLISKDGPSVLTSEMKRVIHDIQLGIPLESSLTGAAKRLGSPSFNMFLNAFLIQREIGGNLAEVIEMIYSLTRSMRSKTNAFFGTVRSHIFYSSFLITALTLPVILFMNENYQPLKVLLTSNFGPFSGLFILMVVLYHIIFLNYSIISAYTIEFFGGITIHNNKN